MTMRCVTIAILNHPDIATGFLEEGEEMEIDVRYFGGLGVTIPKADHVRHHFVWSKRKMVDESGCSRDITGEFLEPRHGNPLENSGL